MNEKKDNILIPTMLRCALLLLMMVGVEEVWGQTVYYEQDYEDATPIVDWTTSVGGRYTPTIATEGENHYLTVNQNQRNQNSCTLTCNATNGKVTAGTNFLMSFDLKLTTTNGQLPSFTIYDAANSDILFSLTSKATFSTEWYLNGTSTTVILPNSNKVNTSSNSYTIDDVDWIHVKIKRMGTTTHVTITPKAGGENIFDDDIAASSTGGLGNMTFYTGRYYANFAIDNVLVTSFFSYNTAATEVDIVSVGTADRPVISGMPTIINETGTSSTITYSSSDRTVAIASNGDIILTGTGTTTITATMGDYSTSYELTVYGNKAPITSTTTLSGETTTATWRLDGEGTVAQSVELGAITMTCAWQSETPVAVKDDSGNAVLKVIDANGYAHANTDGSLPETAYGGTFYKFTTISDGKLTIWGHMATAVLKQADKSTDVTPTSSDANSIVIDNLTKGTYYLYSNSSDYIPILHGFDFVYATPSLEWSANSVTINIMDVMSTNPNMVSGLPTLTKGSANTTHTTGSTDPDVWVKGYNSTNRKVATFNTWRDPGELHICGPGTTVISVRDTDGHTASYTLIVEGEATSHTYNGSNTLTFSETGVLAQSTDADGSKSQTLDTGLTIQYGFTGETTIVTDDGMGTVVKMIDSNGFSHPNLQSENNIEDYYTLPWETAQGGTYFKLTTTKNGYLIVTGNVSKERTFLYRNDNTVAHGGSSYDHNNATLVGGYDGEVPVGDTEIKDNTFSVSLEAGYTYFLYNKRTDADKINQVYVPLVHSITYVPGFFSNAYEVTSLANADNYTIQAVKGFSSPTYDIVKTEGDDIGSPLTISGNKITGITGGGAIRISATQGTDKAYYVLTVAYPATDYPGQFWNFNPSGLMKTTTDPSTGLTRWPVPRDAAHPTAATATDADGGGWTAFWKNANEGFLRGEEWGHNTSVHGDNAFFVPETAGLIFNTVEQGFFLRNNEQDYQNIGIRKHGASFTIPQLSAGDIVELNWKHETGESGSNFTATNLTDLRGKPVNETFAITESAYRSKDNHPGRYSFIATGDGNGGPADVTFTLQDNGNCDILSIRIYKGPYQSTMRSINQQGNINVPNTLMVDGTLNEGYTYNYCNQLYSTATGPAFYVLKGYKSGIDDERCITGSNASLTPETFTDDNAYPITSEEEEQLYELRKHLSFNMYNTTWQSRNNSYNYGHIEGIRGWGKVTIRMNNYTNDMKYLIGYTPDYTLTIGSKPHQTYPYTWDFTNISGQAKAGEADNVYNTITQTDGDDTAYDRYATNWTDNGSGSFTLKTDNTNALASQYVPGAVLVSTEKALSHYTDASSSDYAADELDGLGIDGQITIHTNTTTASSAKQRSPRKVAATTEPMTCDTETTITLPDLRANDWIYVSTTDEPTTVENDGETLSPITSGDDGPDAASGVYKYKVINAGNVNLTFAAGTAIRKIGVTDILKEVTKVGGDGWATESRDVNIDHSLTGFFTINDVNAYTVTQTSSDTHQAIVSMNAIQEDGYVPAQTGVVLRLDDATYLSSANSGNKVPLFYPSVTTSQTTTDLDFPTNNRMQPNINATRWYNETGKGSDENWYTRFILAKRYMTWKKEGDNLTQPVQFISREAPVFYRLHIYNDDEFATMKDENGALLSTTTNLNALNTLGANKAYLLLPTSTTALWDTSNGAPRRYIAIAGVSDMEELEQLEEEEREAGRGDGRIYNLNGQAVGNNEQSLPPGIYVKNGKKWMVR